MPGQAQAVWVTLKPSLSPSFLIVQIRTSQLELIGKQTAGQSLGRHIITFWPAVLKFNELLKILQESSNFSQMVAPVTLKLDHLYHKSYKEQPNKKVTLRTKSIISHSRCQLNSSSHLVSVLQSLQTNSNISAEIRLVDVTVDDLRNIPAGIFGNLSLLGLSVTTF